MAAYGTGLYDTGLYSAALTEPYLTLEWAPNDGPLVPNPQYEDITDRLLAFDWTYGRDDETGNYDAGQGWVQLRNHDRAFDPSYTPGPYYGKIKPRRVFRMRVIWADVSYPVFRAHARGYPQSYPDGLQNEVRIDVADLLALLRAVDLDALGFDRPQETTSERMDAILEAANIPSDFIGGAYGFDDSLLSEATAGDVGDALSSAQNVGDSEMQPLWVDRSGYVGFG